MRLVTASYALSAIARLIPVKTKQVPGYRPRLPAVVWYGGTTAVALALVIGAFVLSHTVGVPPGRLHAAGPARPAVLARPVRPGFHLGVYEPGEGVNYQPVSRFAAAVGREPDLLLCYSGWGEPFQTQFAETAYDHGAELVVQMYPPADISLAAVAAGWDDRFLRSYAAQVRAFRHPVVLSFAPEPNGTWYSWGWTHTPSATWVRAWRHVVSLFRASGATNVTWMLTLNIGFSDSGPAAAYWPGAAYVDWVGIDGYYVRRENTFGSLFKPTVRAVRRLTGKPLLVSEVAVGPRAGQVRGIDNLFAAIRRYRMTGLIWFDMRQDHGLYHQDWRLEDDPAATAAFRRQAKAYGHPLPSRR